MFKRLVILILISFIFLPLNVKASPIPPQDIKNALSKDLNNWQPQMQMLTNNSKQKSQNNITSNNTTDSNYLGDGYAKYNINLSSSSATQNTYTSSNEDALLRFTGYIFLVEGISGSTALAFTDNTSNYKEITGIASSENFSDADFKLPMAKAKELVGFNSSSKLIYDEGHRTIALVTTTNQGERVALLEDSSPLGLKRYDVLSFKELIEKVRNFEAEQPKQTESTNDEFTSGGGGDPTNTGGGTGAVQDAGASSIDHPSTSQSFIWIIGVIVLIGIISYFIYRKRKYDSLSH